MINYGTQRLAPRVSDRSAAGLLKGRVGVGLCKSPGKFKNTEG